MYKRQIGSPIHHNPDRFPAALFPLRHAIRSYYWPGRRHNLLEIYGADGQLVELYADITSPVEVRENEIAFIDHELDVSQLAGQAPRIVDQDEFAAAAVAFGYSDAVSYTHLDVYKRQVVEVLGG